MQYELPLPQLMIDGRGAVCQANRAAEELFERSAGDLEGKSLSESLDRPPTLADAPSRSIDDVFRLVAATREAVLNQLVELTTSAGTQRWLRLDAVPVSDDSAGLAAVGTTWVDVTAHASVGKDRESDSIKLDIAGDSIDLVTWDWDISGGSVRWSPVIENLAESGPDDLLSQIERLITKFDPRGAPSFDEDLQVTWPDGVDHRLSLAGRVAAGAAGSPDRLVGVLVDRMGGDWKETGATHDPLTGLPNRRLLDDRLEQAMKAAKRDAKSVAFLVLDIDGFREINETLGRRDADGILRRIGARLRKGLRKADTLGRFSGDEFAAVLPGADVAAGVKIGAKLLKALETPFSVEGDSLAVTGHVGISVYPNDGRDMATIMQRAEIALNQCKHDIKSVTPYQEAIEDDADGPLPMGDELLEAIEAGQLRLEFSPTINAQTGEVIGLEALVRWEHPQHGRLAPDEFIGAAERTGVIKPLIRWVLTEAIKETRSWRKAGFDVAIGINISAVSLGDPRLPKLLRSLIKQYAFDPSLIELEITESGIGGDAGSLDDNLGHLADMGIRLIVDDFGTGASSVARLARLPIEAVKIDKSLVGPLAGTDDDAYLIVRTLVQLAHNLGIRVIAEGVETEAVRDIVVEEGFDSLQAWYFSKPIPADRVVEWLKKSSLAAVA